LKRVKKSKKMEKISVPNFEDKADLFDFLVENKAALVAEKKYNVKHADAIFCHGQNGASKAADGSDLSTADAIKVRSVINTTNVLDSHGDVHIPKIWNKSLRERKEFYLLQEHKMNFENIISDEVKASAQNMEFKDLGFKSLKGTTQALVFESIIKADRNPFMFKQYAKGFVKNHSVGMRYVKMALAINSEEHPDEFAVWNKYADQVANIKDAEAQGFFWAITEAKILEGSAVPMGSNHVTPTLSTEEKNENIEPPSGTQQPAATPSNDTRKGLL